MEANEVNAERFETKIKQLYSIIIYLSLAQCVVMTLLSGLIINVLYGSAYLESGNLLKVIVWYTTFSYLGSVRSIWMLAQEKQKYLWVINLSGALSNVILNFVLIPIIGAMGAAIASLISQAFTNVIMGFIMKPIRRNNVLMIEGVSPKYLMEMYHYLKSNQE